MGVEEEVITAHDEMTKTPKHRYYVIAGWTPFSDQEVIDGFRDIENIDVIDREGNVWRKGVMLDG